MNEFYNKLSTMSSYETTETLGSDTLPHQKRLSILDENKSVRPREYAHKPSSYPLSKDDLLNLHRLNKIKGFNASNTKDELFSSLKSLGIITEDENAIKTDKYFTLKQLRDMGRDNKIKHWKVKNKEVLVEELKSKVAIPMDADVKDMKRLRYKSRQGHKKVEITNVETAETTMYPSISICSKTLKINPGRIAYYNGRTIDDKYQVRILVG